MTAARERMQSELDEFVNWLLLQNGYVSYEAKKAELYRVGEQLFKAGARAGFEAATQVEMKPVGIPGTDSFGRIQANSYESPADFLKELEGKNGND